MADVIGGLTGVRRVSQAAGVSPATVTHHFRPSGTGRNERLATAALDHAINRGAFGASTSVAEAALDAVIALRSGDPEALRRLALVAADDILYWSPDEVSPDGAGGSDEGSNGPAADERTERHGVGTERGGSEADAAHLTVREATNTAILTGAAVARNDPAVAAILRRHYGTVTDIYASLYDAVLDASDRRLIAGLTTRDIATLLTALADGFIVRRSFEPYAATPDLYGEAVVRLYDALTSPRDAPEDRDLSDHLLPLPSGSNLDAHKRTAIAQAAQHVYDRQGWAGLTITAVQEAAAVSRRTIVANFGDRNGLAAAVWSQHLPRLSHALTADADLPIARRIGRHLERLAALVHAHRDLTGGLLEALLRFNVEHGDQRSDDPADPRALVPLGPALAAAMSEAADAFVPGFVDSPDDTVRSAGDLISHTFAVAVRQPSMSDIEVAERVVRTTLSSMLRDRARPVEDAPVPG